MATAAFVRGNVGVILISQIPAARGKAFWPQNEQVFAADLYEEENPGVTVRRPWENEAEHAARLEKRKPIPVKEPTLNMDPKLAERELVRRQHDLAGLGPDHPQYETLFTATVNYIHELEAILGRKPTQYTKGVVPKKAEDPKDPELVAKVASYKKLPKATREASIKAGKNIELLTLIHDNESSPELKALAIMRIGQVAAGDVE